jgi:hypothetical protein
VHKDLGLKKGTDERRESRGKEREEERRGKRSKHCREIFIPAFHTRSRLSTFTDREGGTAPIEKLNVVGRYP